MVFVSIQPSSLNKFHTGDVVHIKLNDAKGIVRYESNRRYVVEYSDIVGQIHETGVLESDIEHYAEKD